MRGARSERTARVRGAVQGWQHRGAVQGAYEGPHGRGPWAMLNRAYSMSTGGQYRGGSTGGSEARVGLVWEDCREGSREGTAASSERNGAGAAREGNAAMGKWHGEAQHACFPCYNYCLRRLCRRHRLISTPPPPIHLRVSVTLLAPKAFLATAFLMLGRRNVVLWITLERHNPRSGQERRLCMGMVRGAWFSSHQEPGGLISGRGW